MASDRDWLKGHYQYCNRIAVLQFLNSHAVPARLLFIYFAGDRHAGKICPSDETEWRPALDDVHQHVGLHREHKLASRVHHLFLPVACG